MSEEKKNKIKHGIIMQGSILAVAGLIARMIGILRRIPLTNIIGDAGNGYYAAAYEVYALILLLSSYSLPLAVSKLVAARVSRGQYKNANRIFMGSLCFALISGGIAMFFVLFFAEFLAVNVMAEPMSAVALRMLAPTLLIVAVMGVFRGYFQGLGSMTPTAISQIVEQIFLVVFSLLFADIFFGKGATYGKLMMSDTYAPAWGAAGATIGCGIGAAAGLLFLLALFFMRNNIRRKQIKKDMTRIQDSYLTVFRVLIITIVPVILSTVVYNLCGILDQSIYNHYMDSMMLEDIKTVNWGIYSGKFKVLINLPVALASAMCSAIVPSLAASMSNHDNVSAKGKIASAIRVTMMVTIPCAVGLSVLGKPIIEMLFPGDGTLAAQMLMVGTLSIVFYSLSTLGNGILQGLGKMHVPIINAIISLVLHLGILWVMLAFMDLGIFAVVFSNIFFSLFMCVLNHLAIRKYVGYKQEMIKTFAIPLGSALGMGIVIFLLNLLLALFLPDSIACIISILTGMVVYFVFMVLLKGFAAEDLVRIPLVGKYLVRFIK